MLKKKIILIWVSLGVGYIPWAPGTWGSLVGILFAYGLSFVSLPFSVLILTGFVALSFLFSHKAERFYGEKDSQKIVVDEVCGMAIVLLGVDLTLKSLVIGFCLFRFFDILKIPPANVIEKKMTGGGAIMLDDIVAALYARGILELII